VSQQARTPDASIYMNGIYQYCATTTSISRSAVCVCVCPACALRAACRWVVTLHRMQASHGRTDEVQPRSACNAGREDQEALARSLSLALSLRALATIAACQCQNWHASCARQRRAGRQRAFLSAGTVVAATLLAGVRERGRSLSASTRRGVRPAVAIRRLY